MKNAFAFLVVTASLFFAACSEKPKTIAQEIDTPTRGMIKISIDENIQPLADELINAFEYSYPDAFLVQQYGPESAVVQDMYNDTSRLAIMTRPLNKEEMSFFESKKFGVEHIKIASDAVVLLVNRNNPDSSFTVEMIRKILTGEDSVWSQLRPGSTLGAINVVFDNGTSSNLRYLSDTLLGGKAPGKNCFAVTANDSVIDYVNSHPNAIGIVGLNWLSERNSAEDMARRSKISMALIGKESLEKAVHPFQSALVTGDYPFVRGVWIVKIGKRAGLGTGFATFVYGERGQLIIQHAGLAPAAPAERRIKVTE